MKSTRISEGQGLVKLPLKLFPHPLLFGGLKKSSFPPFQVSAVSVYSIFFFYDTTREKGKTPGTKV